MKSAYRTVSEPGCDGDRGGDLPAINKHKKEDSREVVALKDGIIHQMSVNSLHETSRKAEGLYGQSVTWVYGWTENMMKLIISLSTL